MTTSRDKILLEEKVDKIDDINFNDMYVKMPEENIETKDNEVKESVPGADDPMSPSYPDVDKFLSLSSARDEKEKTSLKKRPLFFLFLSIALLLGILFCYNLFVIRSLKLQVEGVADIGLRYSRLDSSFSYGDLLEFP